MTKYVKAIANQYSGYGIKLGGVFIVVGEWGKNTEEHIYEFNKSYGGFSSFYAKNFEPISCPCSVKNCLKHRIEQ